MVLLDNFGPLVGGLGDLATEREINLQNVTLRFVAGNDRAALWYAPEDAIALVLYINVGVDPAGLEVAYHWTQDLMGLAIDVEAGCTSRIRDGDLESNKGRLIQASTTS